MYGLPTTGGDGGVDLGVARTVGGHLDGAEELEPSPYVLGRASAGEELDAVHAVGVEFSEPTIVPVASPR